MKVLHRRYLFFLILLLMVQMPNLKAGEPCCHILICCRNHNMGMTFQVNGEWLEAHDYRDMEQVKGILEKIKEAGIYTVIIDMTNPSQWTRFWEIFEPMVNNVEQACRKMDMEFFLFIGAALPDQIKKNNNIEADDFTFWNGIADTRGTDVERNKYPGDKPFLYYNIVREILNQ